MENEKHSKRITLWKSIFAGINFREFHEFWLISQKLNPAKIIRYLPIREIWEI